MSGSKRSLFKQQVPRYTSYPTAPHFTEHLSDDDHKAALKAVPDGQEISLYIHVPYCHQLCWYCGCNTKITRRYSPVEGFLESLNTEIDLIAEHIGARTISALHFGGGSPSILTSQSFEALMTKIGSAFTFAKNADIAIELDPRNTTEAKIAAYAAAGVNRASLGVQDFSKDVQVAINRYQPFHMVYNTIELLRTYGIRSINLDLLYGLPKQTNEHIAQNVNFAAMLGASRVSLFGYAHVPWFKKHMRLIDEADLPDTDARLEQFELAKSKLIGKGYQMIGLDHFALPDDDLCKAYQQRTLRRNFQGYTTDISNTLIGLGPSSISALPDLYYQNTPDIRQYRSILAEGRLPVQKSKTLSLDDKMRREVIEQLMCYFEVDLLDIAERYGFAPSIFERDIDKLTPFLADDTASLENGRLRLIAEERQLIRPLAACFDSYLVSSNTGHAQVA
jgi:oxygen-independent coproporphyrinogen-3 oxidase